MVRRATLTVCGLALMVCSTAALIAMAVYFFAAGP